MRKFEEISAISFVFIIFNSTINFIFNLSIFAFFSDIFLCAIGLILNFVIIRLIYNYILITRFKSIFIVVGIIINNILIFILLFSSNLSVSGRIHFWHFNNIVENQPVIILLLFDCIYCIYKWVISNNYRIKLFEVLCEVFVLIIFILSSVITYQNIEKNNAFKTDIKYFIDSVDHAIYAMDIGTSNNIDNELNILEESFRKFVCNNYKLSYNEQFLFDNLEDYWSSNHRDSDKIIIKNF